MLQFSMAHLTNLFMSSVNYTFGEEVVSPCEHAAIRGENARLKFWGRNGEKLTFTYFQALFFCAFCSVTCHEVAVETWLRGQGSKIKPAVYSSCKVLTF